MGAQSNLWVQPVMAGGSDFSMPDICLFAARNVPAFTELTYDYGQQYVDEKLGGACLCGATACRGSNPNAASAAQRRRVYFYPKNSHYRIEINNQYIITSGDHPFISWIQPL